MAATVVIPPTADLATVAVVPIPMATTHKAIIGVLVDHLKHPVVRSYHYSNSNASYYYQNSNYYSDPSGQGHYTSPSDNPRMPSSKR